MRYRVPKVTPVVVVWLFIFVVAVVSWGGILFFKVAGAEESVDSGGETSLRDIERGIREIRVELFTLKEKRKTSSDELRIIDLEIEKANLEIERIDGAVTESEEEIAVREEELSGIAFEKERKRAALVTFLRSLSQDESDVIDLILEARALSDLLESSRQLSEVERHITFALGDITDLEVKHREMRDLIERERQKLIALKAGAMLSQRHFQREKEYRELFLREAGKRTGDLETVLAKLRTELLEKRQITYALRRGESNSINFDEASSLAASVSSRVGIRSSLLLGVLSVESDLGESLGVGYWQIDMHPSEWSAFLAITQKLELDPDATPVSAKPGYGWGGAMGPAQFLPSTWLGYEDEIRSFTGHDIPSPWNFEDAMSAAALKLSRDGAATQNPEDEWRAAMIYFAGENWNDPTFSFYGDQVIAMAEIFETENGGTLVQE